MLVVFGAFRFGSSTLAEVTAVGKEAARDRLRTTQKVIEVHPVRGQLHRPEGAADLIAALVDVKHEVSHAGKLPVGHLPVTGDGRLRDERRSPESGQQGDSFHRERNHKGSPLR